jgi:Phage tail protein (Tail_P2_I)
VAKPALTESGERLYTQLAPTFFREDERYGWAGAIFCSALAGMKDAAAEIVQPSDTKPGFAILFDVENVPSKWLRWLAQFVGVDLTTSPNDATSRAWIKAPINYQRGTTAAMELAGKATLTGTKTMYFYVRFGAPFTIKAATLESETPNPTATREAIESMMAAWNVLEYVVVKAGSYSLIEAAHALYSESEAAHTTYEDLELNPSK